MSSTAPVVMIADADPGIRAALRFVFELEDITVRTVGDTGGFGSCVPRPKIDCLVIDQGLAGENVDVARRLRGTIPVIVTATCPGRRLKARIEEVGAWLVEKPLIGDTLIDLVRTLSKSEGRKAKKMDAKLPDETGISAVVDTFYARVREDRVLGPIFNGAIADWPSHLTKLKAFWSSVMLTSGRYKGSPMTAHVPHADEMTEATFARWLTLWRDTTAELLPPSAAEAMQSKAERIAQSLSLAMELRHRHGQAHSAFLARMKKAVGVPGR